MLCTNAVTGLASFGVAGLMGAMWLWERHHSNLREEQLDQAHSRIVRDEQRLAKLVEVVEHNTAAMTRFSETQQLVREALGALREELRNGRKT